MTFGRKIDVSGGGAPRETEVVIPPGGSYGPYGHRVILAGGEKGLRFSLNQIAAKAWEGRAHRSTWSWTSHVLRDYQVDWDATTKQRAAAILDAVQKRFVWLPDARHIEQIAGAHLLFDGEFAGGDCDDAVIALLAAFLKACEKVSIPTAVCAVAYDFVDKDGNVVDARDILEKYGDAAGAKKVGYNVPHLSHVLAKVYLDGAWYYADPSTNDPLGTPSGAGHITREVLVSVDPSRATICDSDVCPIDLEPPSLDEVPGTFQTFDGPHEDKAMDHDQFFAELGEAFGAPPSSWNTETATAELAQLKSDADRLNAGYDANNLNFPGPFNSDGTRNDKYPDWLATFNGWKDEYVRVLQFADSSPGFTMYSDVQNKKQELLDWQVSLQQFGGHVAGPPLAEPDKDSNAPATIADAVGSIFAKAAVAAAIVGGVILLAVALPPLLAAIPKRHEQKAA